MCADTYEELLWHWSFTMPVVAVATPTTATEVMQSLEAHAGLTMVAIIFFLSVLVSTNNGTKDFLWSRRLGVNLSQISSKWINKVTVSSRGLPLTNKEPQPALGELGICLCLRWYRQGLMRKMFASHFQRNLIVKARESLLPLMPPVFFLEDQEGLVGYECCFISHGCPRTPGTWLSGKLY